MKLLHYARRKHALTLLEVLVVLSMLALLAAVLLPILAAIKVKTNRLSCDNNLKEINLSYRIWEGDNHDLYPTGVSVTNGGAMEWVATGDPTPVFQVMSNELSTPRILICPEDKDHIIATNFSPDFSRKNISYFTGLDATNGLTPNFLMCGDDNLIVDAAPVKSGLLKLSTNSSIAWASGRHVSSDRPHFWNSPTEKDWGNVALDDGSVLHLNNGDWQNTLANTGLATNRLAIP
jgi:prepilin-type N-terminal cleavage/methylation domain-containing protein